MAASERDDVVVNGDVYRPHLARVLDVREEVPASAQTKLITTLSFGRDGIDYRPGQFLEVGVFGAGEIPICISSAPGAADTISLTVRAVGVVSGLLARARPGDVLSLRGPCGNGFDLDECDGRDVVIVAGGMGLPALRGLLEELLLRRERYGRIVLLHGARTPQDLLYPWQYALWQQQHVDVLLAVDCGDGQWEQGSEPPRMVGFLTTWFPRLTLDPKRTIVFLCGPPVMIKVACEELTSKLGLPSERCIATLERHMKCGVGKCGHCVVVDRYVCMDGPVFRYDELVALGRIEPPW